MNTFRLLKDTSGIYPMFSFSKWKWKMEINFIEFQNSVHAPYALATNSRFNNDNKLNGQNINHALVSILIKNGQNKMMNC